MNFKDIVVRVNGVGVLATSAEVSSNYNSSLVKSLGVQGGAFQSKERELGSLSVKYYLQTADAEIRGLTGINPVDCQVGTFSLEDCLLTSYSISVKPFDLVEVEAGFIFFGAPVVAATSSFVPASSAIINGEDTTVNYLTNFNDRQISISINISQDFEPVYKLGDEVPTSYSRTNGEISVKIEGEEPASFVDWPCPTDQEVTINFASKCGSIGSVTFSDMTARDISLSSEVGRIVNGSITLGKYF